MQTLWSSYLRGDPASPPTSPASPPANRSTAGSARPQTTDASSPRDGPGGQLRKQRADRTMKMPTWSLSRISDFGISFGDVPGWSGCVPLCLPGLGEGVEMRAEEARSALAM
jgi:hypothetical protein